jgi:hypothetical protein
LLQKVAQDVKAGDYNAASRDLNALGQQASSLSQDQRDQLSASLKAAAAAQAKAGNSQLADSLTQASDALNGSQADRTTAFKQASGSLQSAGQRSQAQQNLNKALRQVQQSANNMAQQTGEGADSGSAFNNNGGGSNSGASQDGSDPSASADGSAGGAQASAGQGQGQGLGQGQGDGTGNGTGGNGTGGSGGQGGETVYTGGQGRFEGLPGQQSANGQVSTSDDNSLADPANNGSNVPYQQVVGQYQQQASQAMDRAAVPLSYRQIVKDYFSSLAPQR